MWRRWLPLALLLIVSASFLALNQKAYQGYFQDDELDNISWAPALTQPFILQRIVSPLFDRGNFRPVGHEYFTLAGRAFGLNFPPYVALIHAIHLINVVIIYFLLRKFGLPFGASALGVIVFALNVSNFDAVWKPMYVFDLLCGTFCLASILSYANRRWILSFVCFWLAYKAKELAVMLPLALLAYEYLLGERKFLKLIPFFLVSLSFGLQGILLNPNKDNDYTFRFTPQALMKTVPFYSDRLFSYEWGAYIVAALPFLAWNRKGWWGLVATLAFFFPLLFLPGRLYSAYCYVPMIGITVMLAAAASRVKPEWLLVAPLGFWFWWNLGASKQERWLLNPINQEVRTWVTQLAAYAKEHQQPAEAYQYKNYPAQFHVWGVNGALRLAYHRPGLSAQWHDSDEMRKQVEDGHALLLDWDLVDKKLHFIQKPKKGTP